MTPRSLHVAIATDRPFVRWQARCVEAIAAVPGVVIDRWLQASVVRPDDSGRLDAGALMTEDVPDILFALQERDAASPGVGAIVPDQPVDILLDLTTDGIAPATPATEIWHYAYGRDLGRDPARAALIGYVRSPGVIRVALVSDPSGAIVREGWLQAVSWWTGKPLERLLTDPADWPAIAARQRLAGAGSGDVAGAGRRPAAGRRPRRRRRPMPAMPDRALEVAALGRRVRGFVDVLGRHPDWNIGIIDAPIEQVVEPRRADRDLAAAPTGSFRGRPVRDRARRRPPRLLRGLTTSGRIGTHRPPDRRPRTGPSRSRRSSSTPASMPRIRTWSSTTAPSSCCPRRRPPASSSSTRRSTSRRPGGRWRRSCPGSPAADATIVEFEGTLVAVRDAGGSRRQPEPVRSGTRGAFAARGRRTP